MKSIQNNKFSGNNGLTKAFYESFWDGFEEFFIVSVAETTNKDIWSILQRQTIAKLR